MIKKSIVFIVFLMFSTGLFSRSFTLDDIFKFDASAEVGILNGTIGEYVFDNNCKNTDNMLSRLDWDVLAVPYGELNISVDLFKYLYIGASGRMGIPVGSGYMQDYDWMNSINAFWMKEDPTELTNYSKHSNEIDKYYNFSVKVGGNIPITRKFTISPYLGYEYDFISMVASGGYTRYKQNNFQEISLPDGKGISYAQEINQFIIGFEIDCLEIPKFPIFFDFHIVPGVGKLGALDIHHLRPFQDKNVKGEATAFLDVISHIFLLGGKLSGYYKFNKYNNLGLSAFINYMPLAKGIDGFGPVVNGKLPDKFYGNATGLGGASRFLFGISVNYKFTF